MAASTMMNPAPDRRGVQELDLLGSSITPEPSETIPLQVPTPLARSREIAPRCPIRPALILLTQGINREGQELIVELAQQTFEGQAHFAGTGPAGHTCRECRFWAHRIRARRSGLTTAGEPKPASCLKAQQLSHSRKRTPVVPHFAVACRHFEPTEPNEEVNTSD